jgi:alkaline phosphatase D
VVTIENLEGGDRSSSLKYRLFVDGVEVWNTMILSPQPASAQSKPEGSFWDRFKFGS